MSYMSDYSLALLENDSRKVAVNDSHSTYPVEYDREIDPDPRILDLEMRVQRLAVELIEFGGHAYPCHGRGVCTCGWNLAVSGDLWKHVGDSEDFEEALASWSDDAMAARAMRSQERAGPRA